MSMRVYLGLLRGRGTAALVVCTAASHLCLLRCSSGFRGGSILGIVIVSGLCVCVRVRALYVCVSVCVCVCV